MHSFLKITQPELEAPHFDQPLTHVTLEVRVSGDLLHHLVEALEAPAPKAPHRPQLEDVKRGMRDVVVLGLEETVELGHLCEANRGADRGADRGTDRSGVATGVVGRGKGSIAAHLVESNLVVVDHGVESDHVHDCALVLEQRAQVGDVLLPRDPDGVVLVRDELLEERYTAWRR